MGRNPFGAKPTIPPQEGAASPFPAFPVGEPSSRADRETGSVRSHIENIPTANFHPKKREDKRERVHSRFMQLIEANQTRVSQLADHLGVPQYDLIRFALDHGLQEIKGGGLVLEPTLAKGALTLYADTRVGTLRKQKQKLINVSCRYIPDELWETVKTLAKVVPLWQVINRLLDYTLTQIERGKLEVPLQQAQTYTLYPEG
jgi:hypothetical protein